MGHEHKKNKNQRARKEVSLMYAEKRDEEIIDQLKFGKPVEEKSDKQLFTISKTVKETPKLLNKREQKKELAKNKLTRAEKILSSNDNVEEISKNKNVTTNVLSSEEILLTRTVNNLQKKKSQPYSNEYLQDMNKPTPNKKKHMMNELAGKNKRKTQDLWEDEQEIDQNSYLHTNEEDVYHPRPTHNKLVKASKSVELPSAGMSYRPVPQEHQQTLYKALQIEKKAERYVKQVEQGLTIQEMPEKIVKKLKVDLQLEKERDIKLVQERDQLPVIKTKEGVNMSLGQMLSINDIKTKKEKKKSMSRAKHQSDVSRRKKEAKMAQDIDHIEKIVKKIDQHEQQIEAQRADRAKTRDETAKSTKKVSNAVADTITEAFLLPSELPSTLSELSNPTFHPLKDRLRSFQKRSLVTNQIPGVANKALFSHVKNYAYDNTREAEWKDESEQKQIKESHRPIFTLTHL
ncbi:hypothetical protein DFA_04872 [Cavenderia fasciculata]|uniref:Ribosome biogenesis protein NOP53 n=1 Tax=Cavenderia fasciculata TaxID=261658 RepID=F4PM39_CACFS|nr:uncharacterized protein DFA_04872 [Cavenderia fasciculata]EGG22742.1 hypothetical protein DFA_04872 [Cavenderia fasciculata]|eukprot:XP_004360593.1 hypothetical protein DFA_04872 [Cavenderia fasciculata]